MSLLERLSSLSRRTILAAVPVMMAASCQSANGENSKAKNEPIQARVCLNQGEEERIEALMMQRKRAGEEEKAFAAGTLRAAPRFVAKAEARGWNWGPAAKIYGESVLCYPTVDALLGEAYSDAMLDRPRPEQQESLRIKLLDMQRAITSYQLAIELGERIGEPMKPDQRKDIEDKIRCLQKFVDDPDPTNPPCQLVKDALRTSKITRP